MPDFVTSIVDFQVKECPVCKQVHDYKLKVFNQADPFSDRNVLLFGGSGDRNEVMFDCPVMKKMFTIAVSLPGGGEIAGVATPGEVERYKVKASPVFNINDDLKEWMKTSRTVALDYCKTMLSSSVGAIAVYFAILKYMGSEKMSQASGKFFILPPVLFLLATVLFVLSIKPRFDLISEEQFLSFRNKRLHQLNNYLVAGTILFITGIASSIFIFLTAF